MTIQGIIKSISSSRLSSYRKIFGCSTDEDCIHYYHWNQALSSELYILMSTIEICLRNKIHIALSEEVSFKFTGLINSNFSWYEHFSFVELDKDENPKIDRNGNDIFTETGKAFRKITHKGKRNLNLLPQIIISKLEFGKWSYVLSAKKYDNGALIDWNKLFPIIFPHFIGMDPDKHHQVIIDHIKVVKNWRNRVAHLEPVWKFSDVKDMITGNVLVPEPTNQLEVLKRLKAEVRRALNLLSWLCVDTLGHYKSTKSYQQLLHLISHDGITDFSY
jgi:hypothetical protein